MSPDVGEKDVVSAILEIECCVTVGVTSQEAFGGRRMRRVVQEFEQAFECLNLAVRVEAEDLQFLVDSVHLVVINPFDVLSVVLDETVGIGVVLVVEFRGELAEEELSSISADLRDDARERRGAGSIAGLATTQRRLSVESVDIVDAIDEETPAGFGHLRWGIRIPPLQEIALSTDADVATGFAVIETDGEEFGVGRICEAPRTSDDVASQSLGFSCIVTFESGMRQEQRTT